MVSRRGSLKVAVATAVAVIGLLPALAAQAGENGPFVQPPYAPVVGGNGPGTPLSSPYAVKPAPIVTGNPILVPNATNSGYVNPLIPTSSLPRPAPRTGNVAPNQPAIVPSSSALPASGVSVSLAAGWDIIGGPAGTVITGNVGPLLTYGPADTAYVSVVSGTPLTAGVGYLAYFAGPVTESITLAPGQSAQIQIPANHFVLIANPGSGTATVTGVDYLAVYSASSGQYQPATTLGPGQGGWAWSRNGGTAIIQSS